MTEAYKDVEQTIEIDRDAYIEIDRDAYSSQYLLIGAVAILPTILVLEPLGEADTFTLGKASEPNEELVPAAAKSTSFLA